MKTTTLKVPDYMTGKIYVLTEMERIIPDVGRVGEYVVVKVVSCLVHDLDTFMEMANNLQKEYPTCSILIDRPVWLERK